MENLEWLGFASHESSGWSYAGHKTGRELTVVETQQWAEGGVTMLFSGVGHMFRIFLKTFK